jgi:hypothetical protein
MFEVNRGQKLAGPQNNKPGMVVYTRDPSCVGGKDRRKASLDKNERPYPKNN